MTIRRLRTDERGSILVESAIGMPLFLSLTFGVVQLGLLTWTWVGLQHAVEMAARCASVSDAAISVGLNPASTPTNCYNLKGSASANLAAVQSYAAKNAYGLNPSSSIFAVSVKPATCPSGNMVSVSNYAVNLIGYIFSAKLNAQSCYTTTS